MSERQRVYDPAEEANQDVLVGQVQDILERYPSDAISLAARIATGLPRLQVVDGELTPAQTLEERIRGAIR